MVRHGVRRLSWGLVDQGSNSLTTLCVSIGVLQGPTTAAAEFALVFLLYGMAVGFSRSITTEPVVQDLALYPHERLLAHVRMSGCKGAVVGLLTALLAVAVVRPETGVGLWSLAFPIVLVATDSVRAAWIGARLPATAVRYSLAQVVAAAIGLLISLLTDQPVWALLPVIAVSAVLALAAVVTGPALTRAALLPSHWFYAGEWLFTSGLSQSSGLLATQALPLLPLLIRAQGVLFGPLSALAQAVAALAVPEFAVLKRRRPSLLGPAAGLTALLTLIAAVYAAFVLLLPDSVAAGLLGETWSEYKPVLLPSIALVVLTTAPMSPLVALRAHGYARTSFGLTIALGVGHLLLPLAGVLVAGLAGFFWGAALSSAIGCVVAMAVLRRAEGRRSAEPVGEPA
jgi:uncharacterized membrane protein